MDTHTATRMDIHTAASVVLIMGKQNMSMSTRMKSMAMATTTLNMATTMTTTMGMIMSTTMGMAMLMEATGIIMAMATTMGT